jgi:hypothetical protein
LPLLRSVSFLLFGLARSHLAASNLLSNYMATPAEIAAAEEKKKRVAELARAQAEAAAAAKAATATATKEATSSTAAPGAAPSPQAPYGPEGKSVFKAPSTAPGAAITPSTATSSFQAPSTPAPGAPVPVTDLTSGTTAPVNTANPLIHEKVFNAKVQATQKRLEGAADTYRKVAEEGASPGQLQAAKQEFANALEAKALAARQVGGAPAGRSRPMQETGARTAFEAFGMPERNEAFARNQGMPAYVRPGEDQASIDRYNAVLLAKGINPRSIREAELVGNRMEVPTLTGDESEQTKARAAATEAARIIRQKEKDIRQARRSGKWKLEPEGYAKLQKMQEEVNDMKIQSGLAGPGMTGGVLNPESGFQRALAYQRLSKDPYSLSGRAEEQIIKQRGEEARQKEERKQGVASQTPGEPSAELVRLANYNAQQQQLRFDEEERRRRELAAQLYGPSYTNNYYR